jgi:hypothetical protein
MNARKCKACSYKSKTKTKKYNLLLPQQTLPRCVHITNKALDAICEKASIVGRARGARLYQLDLGWTLSSYSKVLQTENSQRGCYSQHWLSAHCNCGSPYPVRRGNPHTLLFLPNKTKKVQNQTQTNQNNKQKGSEEAEHVRVHFE